MGIEADLKWRLQSSEVKEADMYRRQINRNLSIMWMQSMAPNGAYASLETRKRIGFLYDNIAKIKEKLSDTDIPSFDKLYFEDVLRNSELAESICQFRYDINHKRGVEKFINGVFGKRTYGKILDSITPENFPHDKIHEHGMRTHMKKSRQICSDYIFSGDRFSPKFEQAKNTLLGQMENYKQVATSFYKDFGIVENLEDFNFEFCPPGYGFSYWDEGNFMVHLDADRAYFFEDPKTGELLFEDLELKPIVVHEVSHGLHTKLSRNMPQGLSPTIEDYLPVIHGSCGEGVALRTELFWMDYQRKKENADLTSSELAEVALEREIYLSTKLPQISYDLLSLKETEQKNNDKFPEELKIEAGQVLARISQIKKYGEFMAFDDRSIDDTLQQMTYLVGNKKIGDLTDKLRGEGLEDSEIMRALFHGTWCDLDAQEKFIFDFYLEGKN